MFGCSRGRRFKAGRRFKELGEQEREGLRTAYHFLPICLRDLSEPEQQIAVLHEGIALFPDDLLLPKLLERA